MAQKTMIPETMVLKHYIIEHKLHGFYAGRSYNSARFRWIPRFAKLMNEARKVETLDEAKEELRKMDNLVALDCTVKEFIGKMTRKYPAKVLLAVAKRKIHDEEVDL